MIYASLFAAFAATAFGADCKNDVTAAACRTFNKDKDFFVENAANQRYNIKVDLDYNNALQTVTTTPWNKLVTDTPANEFGQTTNGCVFSASLAGGPQQLGVYKCSQTVSTACTDAADGIVRATNNVGLVSLVSGLNTQGSYELYFQRVQTNPIGLDLKWIAENACKVTMPVSFECTGSDCVEVQNIVCASFAGISDTNHGVVSMECKVPPKFKIRSTVNGNADDKFSTTNAAGHFNTVVNGVGQTTTPTQACGNSKCQITLTSTSAIGAGQTIQGSIVAKAEVQALTMSNAAWSGQLDTFHTANYDLSRKSAPANTLSMPVGVNYYSDEATLATATLSDVDNLFPPGVDSVPFLATQRVDLGVIKKHNNGFLRIVAKVPAAKHWFLSHKVTSVEVDKNGAGFVADSSLTCNTHSGQTFAVGMTLGTAALTHTTSNHPKAFLVCPGIMTGIDAGDVMRFSLEWQLANTVKNAAGNGKAALLQDAPESDPNAQSVEVQLTIQLGGGETNITTGAADGAASADNTVTYIIIAVCVIAAALILAVVVVAFMCLRNRSQEQMVSMSPQKCTVAAVYDISAPKKADAMDV